MLFEETVAVYCEIRMEDRMYRFNALQRVG
jgi:hypothetical protein